MSLDVETKEAWFQCCQVSYFLYFRVEKTKTLNHTVFPGYVGGSHFNNRGAAVEPLCLPRNPQWLRYRYGIENERAYVHGAEYETRSSSGGLRGVHDQDVPCAVCLKRKRFVVNMFPGREEMFRCF